MIKVDAADLKRLYREVILRLGGSATEAETFAERFVVADLRGMDWQGLKSLGLHVIEPLQRGIVKVRQEIRTEAEGPSSLALEANGELGQVACSYAMEFAIAKANETGTAAFTIKHCGDTGLLASYTSLALEHASIAILFNNTNPYFAPWGGNERVHGIDPLSIAIPAGEEYPVLMDLAIPGRSNFDTPDRWEPPYDAPPLLFFETVREYVLSVALELIAGALTTMPLGREKTRRGECAVVGVVLHVPHYISIDRFRAHADSFIRQVKTTEPREGQGGIQLPGERGFREQRKRLAEGIPVSDELWAATARVVEPIGLDLASVMAGRS